MAKKKRNKSYRVDGRHFTWLLTVRNGYYQADGRSNEIDLKRHSLGTKDFEEAKKLVHDLDLHMAVKLGIAEPHLLHQTTDFGLPIEVGLTVFRKHMKRPNAAKGIAASTQSRYERGLKAHERFFTLKSLQYWEQVNEDLLDEFANWRSQDCAETTVATELTLLCQVQRHLIRKKRLDPRHALDYPIYRPKESTRYCPTLEEMKAILEWLRALPEQKWLHDAVAILSHTGLRFGELAQMTYDDIERVDAKDKVGKGILHVRHESRQGGKKTKSKYSRKVPINTRVAVVLDRQTRSDNDDLLLHGPRGGKLRCDIFSDHLREHALRPLQSKFPHAQFQTITAHSLRHFFNSNCAANNISQQAVMDWMGHRTSLMTKRYYHSNDEASLRNIEKIEPILDVPPERTDDTLSNTDEPEAGDSEANDANDK